MISSIFLPSVKGYNISKLSSGKYAVAVNNGNMGACQMDKQQFDEFISKQKAQGNVSASKGAKITIGTGLAVLAVAAGLIIRNKKVAKALAEEAKKFGFEDVEMFKEIKKSGITFTKVENATFEECIEKWALDIARKNNDIRPEYEVGLVSPKVLEEIYSKKFSKDVKFPENCFMRTVEISGEAGQKSKLYGGVVCYDKIQESMKNGMDTLAKEGGVVKVKIQNPNCDPPNVF